jgi:hypothetical protein
LTERRTPIHDGGVTPRPAEQHLVELLADAVRGLGFDVRPAERGSTLDLIVFHNEATVVVEVKDASLVTADSAAGQLRRWSTNAKSDAIPMIVADRITADGRERLNEAGWSWLDLRGHLRLVGGGVFVDTDVPALSEPRPVRQGLIGKVGVELAALLLVDPTSRIGVRAAAAALGRSPSSISQAFAALRATDLVDANHEPAVPELFWELAEHWKPASEDVASIPVPNRGRDTSVLRLGLDDVESTTGWALTDTVAAAHYGAPVSMRADHPPDFYVPDRSTLRRAVTLLGAATTPTTRAGRIRLAPAPLVCARRVDATAHEINESWPLAHPLFVALDLAQDPGRGREILNMWTPMEPWHRVW